MSSTRAYRCAAACARLLFLFAACVGLSLAQCPASGTSNVRELLERAQTAMQRQQFREAAASLQEAACLEPRNAQIFYGLGVAQAGGGDFLAARKSLATADRLEPTNPLPLAMTARVNVSMNDADGLKATLRDAAERFPRNGVLHGTLAQFLAQNKLFDLALAESLRAQSAEGASPQSMMELAVLENTVGGYDDAIRNAEKIAKNAALPNPIRAAASGVAGLSYQSLGQTDAALLHLREAMRLDPSQENSYLALAFLLEKGQKYAEAVTVLEKGRRELPASTTLLLPLGTDLVLAERFKEAIQVLRDLLKKAPDQEEAYLQIADAYRKNGNPAQEIEILRELLQRKPDYPNIHRLLARAILSATPPDTAAAVNELELAEKINPTDPEVFYLRGRACLAANQNEQAMAAFEHATQLAPLDPGPYYQLGLLYKKLGKTALANETLARMQFLKSSPSK